MNRNIDKGAMVLFCACAYIVMGLCCLVLTPLWLIGFVVNFVTDRVPIKQGEDPWR